MLNIQNRLSEIEYKNWMLMIHFRIFMWIHFPKTCALAYSVVWGVLN